MLVVLALGRRHSELYKIPRESYGKVAEALLWTLDFGLGAAFTREVRDAWTRVYTLLAQTMQMGSAAIDPDPPLASAEVALALGDQALSEQEAAEGMNVPELGFVQEAP
jgi:hypothetical protein